MKALIVVPALVLAASLGFLVASCSSNGDATSAGPVPSLEGTTDGTSEEIPTTTAEEPTTTDSGTQTEPSSQVTYQVWFRNTDGLFLTYRTEPATSRVGTAALESLLEGPDSFEQGYGLRTAIPGDTQVLGLEIDRGIAYVDLSSEFEAGNSNASFDMRLAQIVYTLTQFPTVTKGVIFRIDGVQTCTPDWCDKPITRRDYGHLLPPILVTSPALNQEVGSPVVLRGSANVFEANVGIEILDENGDMLAQTFTTATCGTGCRGTFRARVAYDVDTAQDGTIVLHDDDAAGTGTFPNEVRIPVRLLP
jgi:Sporulation and spore germination/Immunoglobulin-like domain of bacterial spore germination